MQDSHNSVGIIPMPEDAWLLNQLAKREGTGEVIREHDLSRIKRDLPTAHASDLSAPSTVAEAEASKHVET